MIAQFIEYKKGHRGRLKIEEIFITILLVWLSATSCTAQGSKPNDCSHIHLTPGDLKETKSKKILLLMADDRSASAQSKTQPQRITEDQYKEILQIFISNDYIGQFDIRIIGNTPTTGFEKILSFDALFDKQQIPEDATLTQKGKIRCINERITDTCEQITKSNQKRVDDYIAKIIRPNIINYKPAGKDATDIDGAFRDIEMRLNASKSYSYDKVIVVIMSDGKDSNNSSHLMLNTRSPFELILIGWPTGKKVSSDSDTYFDNVDAFINWFKKIKL